MTYILAVDGGGTKTVAVLASEDGRIIGAGRAGSCDIYGGDQAYDAVRAAVMQACAKARVTPGQIGHAVYSLCGADWPEDIADWERYLRDQGLGRHITVVNDAIGAMAAEGTTGNLLAVIIGTGCATGSRNGAGDHWHSSFWQLVQGGGEISAAVLEALYKADLGISGPTALTAKVLAHLGHDTVEDLLHAFTARNAARPAQAAGLTPILLDVADAGDAVALQIVTRFAQSYADMALAAARQVAILGQPARVMFAGGVLRHPSPVLRDLILQGIAPQMGALTLVADRSEPIQGGVLMALRAAGVTPDTAIKTTIARTLPDADFFQT